MDSRQNLFDCQKIIENQNIPDEYLILQTNEIISKLKFVEICTKYWYQGKGRLTREGQIIQEDKSIFPMAKRSYKDYQRKRIRHGESILSHYRMGDKLQFLYLVSEGDKENELIIQQFEVYLVYTQTIFNKVLPQIEQIPNISTNCGKIKPICVKEILEEFVQVIITLIWEIQGQGICECFGRLIRDNKVINDYMPLFEINSMENDFSQDIKEINTNEYFLENCQVGDILQFGYRQGDYEISIHQLEIEFKNKNRSTDSIEREIQNWVRCDSSQQLPKYKKEQQEDMDIEQVRIQIHDTLASKHHDKLTATEILYCKLCEDKKIARMFQCGHALLCDVCYQQNQFKKCPICRQASSEARKIYFI